MENNALIRVDAMNLNSSINQPQFKALLSKGWKVVGMVPIDDDGNPFLVFILSPPRKESRDITYLLGFVCFQTVLLFFILIKDYIFGL